jgi:hypothetical protein
MVRFGPAYVFFIAFLGGILSAPVVAQSSPDNVPSSPYKVRVVPPAVDPGPFPVGGTRSKSTPSIELRAPEQMSPTDRLVASNDESSIAEHAQIEGFDLNQGKWAYAQIVCPAFPNHLFLRYTQNNGVGDVTVFSASIPRNGQGRVRIIPIQKRSYSLFSPAPVNAMTISAFNHVRAEEGTGQSSSWLGNALCYAALAGAKPRLASEEELRTGGSTPALNAILEVPVKGGEVIRFVDEAAKPRPMQWTMTFSPQGKLTKATHVPAPSIETRSVPINPDALPTIPVPQSANN